MAKFSIDVSSRTVADINRDNAAAYGAGGVAESDWAATNAKFGYEAGYPEGPAEGLGKPNSVAEIQASNARAYGPASSFKSPTNMVGDAEHAVACGVRKGEDCTCGLAKDDETKLSTEMDKTKDRKYPSYTTKELEVFIASGKGNAEMEEEVAARKSGASTAKVTPQLIGGKPQTKVGRM